jgi:hypothetical protein
MRSALLLLVWVASLAAYEVKVRVFDDRGEAIVGAKITVFFVKQGKSGGVTGVSGSDGAFMADGKSTLGVDIIAECAGHYSSRADNLKNGMDHEVKMVLPRVLKPTALFALRDFWPKIPSPGQWYGFDFEAGDWVAPHGKGKTVDVLFRYTSDFKGWKDDVLDPVRREWVMAANKARDESAKKEWSLEKFKAEHGKWDGVLQVAFPGKQEGAVEQKFISYNEMKMPHAAPVDGYVAALEFSANTYSYPKFRQDIGFFLRTRVRLDKDGNIASANYSKIHGDFVFYPADGKMNFTYYYNPMPNDRNLEFAPKKNLFPEDKKGAFVQSP